MGDSMPIVFYDSLGDFCASLPEHAREDHDGRDRWAGNQTYKEAKANLWQGDRDALKTSDDFLEKLESDGIELAQAHWEHARTGFIPCIPSYLAGSPESMRRLGEYKTENAPIRIFTDVCLSGGFKPSELATRGAAILALARKLQAIRPVELYLLATMHGKDAKDGYGNCAIPVISINTSPLDLSSVSYAMANAAFLRRLCFVWGDERGFSGSWAWNGNPRDNRARVLKYLNIAEQDLLIDGAYIDDQLMKNPVEWVNDQVRKYADTLEESA